MTADRSTTESTRTRRRSPLTVTDQQCSPDKPPHPHRLPPRSRTTTARRRTANPPTRRHARTRRAGSRQRASNRRRAAPNVSHPHPFRRGHTGAPRTTPSPTREDAPCWQSPAGEQPPPSGTKRFAPTPIQAWPHRRTANDPPRRHARTRCAGSRQRASNRRRAAPNVSHPHPFRRGSRLNGCGAPGPIVLSRATAPDWMPTGHSPPATRHRRPATGLTDHRTELRATLDNTLIAPLERSSGAIGVLGDLNGTCRLAVGQGCGSETCAVTIRQPCGSRTQVWDWRPSTSLPG